jgi:3-oxoacyl-[acyl-carrier-protein] synthase III
MHNKVLIIGADVMTSIIDFQDAPPAFSSATVQARSR